MKKNKPTWFNGLTYFLFLILINFDQALGMQDQEVQDADSLPSKRILTRAKSDPGTLRVEENNPKIPTLTFNPIYGCSLPDLRSTDLKNKEAQIRRRDAGRASPPLLSGLSISSSTNSPQPDSPRGSGRPRSSSSPRGNISAQLIKKSEPFVLGSLPHGQRLGPPKAESTKRMAIPELDLYQLLEEDASLPKSPRKYLRRSQSDPQAISHKQQRIQEKKGEKADFGESPEPNPSQRSDLRPRRKRTSSVVARRPPLVFESSCTTTAVHPPIGNTTDQMDRTLTKDKSGGKLPILSK
ncbi:MAG TPA: hypothetical protein VMW10_02800 [Alphaproteobacteria bacterium]|nr:hypothetical protein [Alphaproteobacteria bacterium]